MASHDPLPAAPGLQALFEAVPFALLALDASGRIVCRNAEADALVGAAQTASDLVSTEDHPLMAARLLDVAASGARAGPVTLHLSGGATAEAFAAPFPPAGPGGLALTLRDLRAQARLEAELTRSQRLQAAGQIAAGLAHDFNNLLTAIGGAADALKAKAAADGADAVAQDAADITQAVARGAALVRQLLAFTRQQALALAPLSLNASVRALTPLLQRLLGPTIAVRHDLDPLEPWVMADPGQVDQVLMNLAANARDAMPGGGTLVLRSFGARFFRKLRHMHETIPPGDYVAMEVEDTGTGMEPEVLARLFEPFFTTRRAAGGTGLGLSMVQGTVRQSSGFVIADSTPGSGTRIRVYWRRATPAPRADHGAVRRPAELQAPPPAAGGTLLLVDDEEIVRRVAARALAACGWRVFEAGSAAEALALADAAPPDLLITDVAMPDVDGPRLAAALRQRWPHLPVLLVSGYADAATRAGAAAPRVRLLLKPYTMADLAREAANLAGIASPQADGPNR